MSPTTLAPTVDPSRAPTLPAPTRGPSQAPTLPAPTSGPSAEEKIPSCAPDLLVYLPFDDSSEDDASGNAIDCTIHGAVSPASNRLGSVNAAFDFAVDGYVQCPNEAAVGGAGERTYCTWMRVDPTVDTRYRVIFTHEIQAGQCGRFVFRYKQNGKGDGIFNFAGVQCNFRFPGKLEDPFAWHFVCITYDGVDLSLFVNGDFFSSVTPSVQLNSAVGPLYIGKEQSPGRNDFFHGSIDEVSTFSTSLSAEYIRDIYEQTSPSRLLSTCAPPTLSPSLSVARTPTPSTKCTALDAVLVYMPFSGGTALDTSANALQCSIQGAVVSTADRLGVANAAFDFGNDNFIECPNGAGIAGAGARTYCAWVRIDENADTAYRTIFTHDTQAGQCGRFAFRYKHNGNGKGIFNFAGVMCNFRFPGSIDDPFAWHFACISYDGVHLSLHIDGEYFSSVTPQVQLNSAAGPLYIGKAQTPQSHDFFHGAIDEVSTFSRSLTGEEVSQIYTRYVARESLLACW